MTQAAPLSELRAPPPSSGVAVLPPQVRRLTVHSFGSTDRGRQRETNQDQFLTAALLGALWVQQTSVPQSAVHYSEDRGQVFVVADGMGGARGGEQASALAVGALEGFLLNALRWLLALDDSTGSNVLREFKAALRGADERVYAAAAADPELRGMGTTLTMAYSRGADLFVAHAGDSRCYLFRNGALQQLTRDHTLVQEMIETKLIPPEAAATHELRHVITNAVGGPTPGVHAEVHQLRLEPGDGLLLCTDGLTGMLTDAQIAAVLRALPDPQQACEALISAANEQGGVDNVTAVVARYS